MASRADRYPETPIHPYNVSEYFGVYTETMAELSVQAAARDYLRRGWSVIPVRAGEKRPAIP